MGFRFVTADTNGAIYAVTDDGNLLFYRDEARDGTPRWANGGIAQVVGTGWESFQHVLCDGDGVIYAIDADGQLLWFQDLAQDGTSNWANGGAGQVIGTGWSGFSAVLAGGNGRIYAINGDGELLFFHDLARDGTERWANGTGQIIGTGWDAFATVISGGEGILYAIDAAGNLSFFRDLARDGSEQWANGGIAQVIGDGWGNFAAIACGGDGIFYAISYDGFMLFYRDLARDGTASWAFNGAAVTLGSGWLPGAEAPVTIEGYAKPISSSPGQSVEFMVSAASGYHVTFRRLGRTANGDAWEEVGDPIDRPGGLQAVPENAARNGCGWPASFRLDVPGDWASGIYTAHCEESGGSVAEIAFCLRPPTAAASHGEIAILANTITWNLYNDWGGFSKYTKPVGSTLSFERPNPYLKPEVTGIDHLLGAELWIIDWFRALDATVDIYADLELHRGITGLNRYRAIVLSTHPEYWTARMLDRLEAYIAAGGNVLYLGGNGLFEQVELDAGRRHVVCMGDDPAVVRDAFYFRNLAEPRPERAIVGVGYRYDNYMTFAPFEVLAPDHRFFGGTGLQTGSLIGASGLNGGGASGWEMDTSEPGSAPAGVIVSANGADDRGDPPPNLVLLARGTNPGFGADMVTYDTDAGGLVFAAGSISFGGSLAIDPDLQAILRNVVAECLA